MPCRQTKVCRLQKVNSKEYYSNRNFAREEVRAMLVPTSGGEYPSMTFEKFKNGKEPKQCDPNFKVQALKDYVVE